MSAGTQSPVSISAWFLGSSPSRMQDGCCSDRRHIQKWQPLEQEEVCIFLVPLCPSYLSFAKKFKYTEKLRVLQWLTICPLCRFNNWQHFATCHNCLLSLLQSVTCVCLIYVSIYRSYICHIYLFSRITWKLSCRHHDTLTLHNTAYIS